MIDSLFLTRYKIKELWEKIVYNPKKEIIKMKKPQYKNKGFKNQDESVCKHSFELSRIETIPTEHSTTGVNFFYKKIGIVICVKCGEVRQNDL